MKRKKNILYKYHELVTKINNNSSSLWVPNNDYYKY